METAEAHAAAAGGDEKRAYVQRIFSEIAPRYDLLNHLLSLNIDKGWRRQAIDALGWEKDPTGTYVDLCAGTMDVSVQLAKNAGFAGRVVSADFAEPMLKAGVSKTTGMSVSPVVADALDLPLPDNSASGAIVAFGIRNVADLDRGLGEILRVLSPGSHFVILEFTTPPNALVRAVYQAYFHHVLPWIGGMISGHKTAYAYLPRSVANFPVGQDLAARFTRTGFVDVQWRTLTLGVVAIHRGTKR
ncbi:MAG: ubiquinone/menaquinone biosynthesis methyltransferase [Gemmatimonadaceae bacterium]